MPKIKPIPNSCAKCDAPRVPNKSYCRAHWNEYMRSRKAAPRRKPNPSAARPHHCARCEIIIRAESGLCRDCAQRAPLIQTAHLLGSARFWQKNEPRGSVFADMNPSRRTDRVTKPSKYA